MLTLSPRELLGMIFRVLIKTGVENTHKALQLMVLHTDFHVIDRNIVLIWYLEYEKGQTVISVSLHCSKKAI